MVCVSSGRCVAVGRFRVSWANEFALRLRTNDDEDLLQGSQLHNSGALHNHYVRRTEILRHRGTKVSSSFSKRSLILWIWRSNVQIFVIHVKMYVLWGIYGFQKYLFILKYSNVLWSKVVYLVLYIYFVPKLCILYCLRKNVHSTNASVHCCKTWLKKIVYNASYLNN